MFVTVELVIYNWKYKVYKAIIFIDDKLNTVEWQKRYCLKSKSFACVMMFSLEKQTNL